MFTRRLFICSAAFTVLFTGAVSNSFAQTRETETVLNSTAVLDEVMRTPGKQIPQSLLEKAEGIVIIPNMIKGGFVIGARHGHGVALIRNESGGWNAPRFLQMTGGSVGFQAGVQSTDIILVFMTKKSVQGLLQRKFTIGADAAAAAGPVGRQVAAATDERFQAEILSYARSRGLFAGVSLDGSAIRIDPAAEAAYYHASPNGTAAALPQPAADLISKVMQYSGEAEPVSEVPATAIPKRGSTPVGPADQKRDLLAEEVIKLSKLLPPEWQMYLAFPAQVFNNGEHPPVEQLKELESRFQKVEMNQKYQPLSEKPEFKNTHRLLKEYIAALAPKSADATLQLPPVPLD